MTPTPRGMAVSGSQPPAVKDACAAAVVKGRLMWCSSSLCTVIPGATGRSFSSSVQSLR